MTKDCPVCLIPCHGPTHFATIRLHCWWKAKLQLLFVEPEPPKVRTGEPWSGSGAPPAPEEIRPNGRVHDRPDVTLEAIRALQAKQLSRQRISKALGCSRHLISDRLKAAEVAG